MNKYICFAIPIEPRGQKRDRIAVINGHARSYKDSAQSNYETKLKILISQYKPATPIQDAIELEIKAFMPIPVSNPRNGKHLQIRALLDPQQSRTLTIF